MYPSILGEFNIAPNTQIGKIIVPEKVYDHENVYGTDPERYSRGGEFIENMVTDNHIEFCHRWFKLANVEEMLEDIDEFFNPLGYGKFSEILNDNTVYHPIKPSASNVITVVRETPRKTYQPLIFHTDRNSNINYNTLKEEYDGRVGNF